MTIRVPDRFRVGIARYQPGTDDPDELAGWWRQTFGAVWLDPLRNTWLYELNPCLGDDGPGPWVCRRDGRIVGQQGEIPFDLQVGSELRRAVWAVDLSVDEGWRLRGIGPALVATLLERRPIVCMLDLSDEGYAAFRSAGCVDLGILPTYRRPLDVRRASTMDGVPARLRRLAPVLGPLLQLADLVAAAVSRLVGTRLEGVERFDRRADQVWTTVRAAYPVLARRDLAALSWRVDQRPDAHLLQRYYLVRRGRTLGYVVLRPTTSSGERAVVVVDYLARPRWVALLLLLAGATARREGAVSLSVKTRNPRADRALRATGFVRRRLGHDVDRRIMVHCHNEAGDRDPAVATLVEDPDAWLFTSTDSNLEHASSDGRPTPGTR